jgi:uncharacterized membrane protein
MTRVSLALLGIACAFPTQAAYNYTSIDYPGVDYSHGGYTFVFGINDEELVGNAGISGTSANIPFVYNRKTKLFTVLPNFSGASTAYTLSQGINEDGVVVGGESPDNVVESGFILNKGAFTIFSHPGSLSNTEARAISNSGLVAGIAYDATGSNTSGFIYNPKRNSFIDFLPSTFTLAQGINARGEVVGSVELPAGGAYPGSPGGTYGFLRGKSGAITLFRVNSGRAGGRGITDSGRIAGFFTDPVAGKDRGFVAKLEDGPAFQSLTISAGHLLDFPGSTGTIPEGISNEGAIGGIWFDGAGASHGFLATLLESEQE